MIVLGIVTVVGFHCIRPAWLRQGVVGRRKARDTTRPVDSMEPGNEVPRVLAVDDASIGHSMRWRDSIGLTGRSLY
jgi:hypothetical protein